MKIETHYLIPRGYRFVETKSFKNLVPGELVFGAGGVVSFEDCRGWDILPDWPCVIVESMIPERGDWVRIPSGQIRRVCRVVKTELMDEIVVRVSVEGESKKFLYQDLELMDRTVKTPDFESVCKLIGGFGDSIIDEDGLMYHIESVLNGACGGVRVVHPKMTGPQFRSFIEIQEWMIGVKTRAKPVGRASFTVRS